ncbi:hypothetical protein GA707_17725 [Nostocoides sp. F2B08]|uniref:hypothetical protein n=1 Tax=Nostocoides sp. F2B08 TaxID=2653936 RepID=UPI0012634564|nr:hypothetical protein [Tetrasphaera sp. F2B08]KAB7741388.1 hypothetical protein GA707_17725 [Tetrasphaera sp. F2B08]
MSESRREALLAGLGTAALVVLVAALGWLGLRSGDLAAGPVPSATPTASIASPGPTTPRPTPTVTASATPTLVEPDAALTEAFDEEVARLGGSYALAWLDAEGLHLLGSAPGSTAWSTIKVPLSVAALEADPGAATWTDVEAALTRSDNAAADALWAGLGDPEAAAAAVDAVLTAYDSPATRTESERVSPPFSPYGQTVWSVTDAARFAGALACAPAATTAGEVRQVMSDVVADQRWGIGELDSAHLKGGWGPEGGGAYVLRQLGDGQVGTERFALALSARAEDGVYASAAGDVTGLVRWWAETVAPEREGLTCQE